MGNEVNEPKDVDEVLNVVDETLAIVHEREGGSDEHRDPENDLHPNSYVDGPQEDGDVSQQQPNKDP